MGEQGREEKAYDGTVSSSWPHLSVAYKQPYNRVVPILLAVLFYVMSPYWDTLKKRLASDGIPSLTILQSPNIVGHPVGILALVLLGVFALPSGSTFFAYWFGMIAVSSISLTLVIWGLLRTKFFGVQALNQLGFVASSIAAVLLLGERYETIQIIAIGIALIGALCFVLPRIQGARIKWDIGVLYVVVAVALSGLSSALYKLATLHTPDYLTFLSGRFVGDLIGWTLVGSIGLLIVSKKNPIREFVRLMRHPSGWRFAVGVSVATLLSSWLIYTLPLSMFAMLSSLTIPAGYFWSRLSYKETITPRMWTGAILIFVSVIVFISQGV